MGTNKVLPWCPACMTVQPCRGVFESSQCNTCTRALWYKTLISICVPAVQGHRPYCHMRLSPGRGTDQAHRSRQHRHRSKCYHTLVWPRHNNDLRGRTAPARMPLHRTADYQASCSASLQDTRCQKGSRSLHSLMILVHSTPRHPGSAGLRNTQCVRRKARCLLQP